MSYSPRLTSDDVQRVEDAVRKHPLPAFVTGFDVEFGDDHDGDPALWVLFKLRDGGVPNTARIKEIQPQIEEMNHLASAVRSDVVDIVPDRIVYTRFTADKPRKLG